jgi:hypothetical protein
MIETTRDNEDLGADPGVDHLAVSGLEGSFHLSGDSLTVGQSA